MNIDADIVTAFLEESRENLDQMDLDLVALEANPDDPEVLARVFRAVHTIKGTSGFLGYAHLQDLSHAGEDLLGALRSHEIPISVPITTTLLRLVDELRAVLDRVETLGEEGADDHGALVSELRSHLGGGATATGPPGPGSGSATTSATAVTAPPVAPNGPAPVAPNGPAPVAPNDPATIAPAEVVGAPSGSREPPAEAAGTRAEPVGHKASVRVDVSVLDSLQDLVGELTLTRSRIGAVVDGDSGPLAAPYQSLRLLTRQLQDEVMLARLQPVGSVLGRAPRIARDVATSLGKSVRVTVAGEGIAVDRAVAEALRDPVTHLVRNAVDHGIESSTERAAAGKNPQALLQVAASVQRGRVIVEVTDDGRGIDASAIALRAMRLGLLTEAEAASRTSAELLDFVFRPGFSTREQASAISGRGVGMDIVRENVARIGGSVSVETRVGSGTRFVLDVPMMVAVVPALTVECAGTTYAVPQADIETVAHLAPEEAAATVDDVAGGLSLRYHGRLLPLLRLSEVLRTGAPAPGADASIDLVVIASHGRRFALLVDGIGDTLDAVAKPLPLPLRHAGLWSGATILPDGRPALILDGPAVAAEAGVPIGSPEAVRDMASAGQAVAGDLLVAVTADGNRLAFELDRVQRIVRVPGEAIRASAGLRLLPHEDALLPLLAVDAAESCAWDHDIAVVVCSTAVGTVGIVVDEVEDVVRWPALPAQPATRDGITARLMVADQVVELVDVEAIAIRQGVRRGLP